MSIKNAGETHVVDGQLLADLPYRLMELVHGNQTAPVVVDLCGNQPVSQVIASRDLGTAAL